MDETQLPPVGRFDLTSSASVSHADPLEEEDHREDERAEHDRSREEEHDESPILPFPISFPHDLGRLLRIGIGGLDHGRSLFLSRSGEGRHRLPRDPEPHGVSSIGAAALTSSAIWDGNCGQGLRAAR